MGDEQPIGDLELRGPGLTLRYPVAADAPALFELGTDPEVTRFFSWGPYGDLAQAADFIDSLPQRRAQGVALEFLILDGHRRACGITGLSEPSRRDRRAVVGTWLARDRWGTGANAESKALLAALAFGVLGLERLGAYASTLNVRSQVALERAGFTREGVLRAFHRHGPDVHDVAVFSLLASELAASPLAAAAAAAAISGRPPAAWARPGSR